MAILKAVRHEMQHFISLYSMKKGLHLKPILNELITPTLSLNKPFDAYDALKSVGVLCKTWNLPYK